MFINTFFDSEHNTAFHMSNFDRNISNSNLYSSSRKSQNNRDYGSMNQYESEVLEKIKNEDLFSEISEDSQNDYLGEFVDRVIERSLYIYKNK